MIGSTTNTAEFAGNESTDTAYVIPFRYDAASWVHVVLVDEDGVAIDLEQVTDYTLAGDGAATTGTFTTTAAIPATSTLLIYREASGLQTLDLEPNTPLPAASMESQLDQLAMASMDRTTRRWVESRLREIGVVPILSADVSDATSADTPDVLVKRNASGAAWFKSITITENGQCYFNDMISGKRVSLAVPEGEFSSADRSVYWPDASGYLAVLPYFADSTAANASVSVGDAWYDTTLKKARVRLS